MDSSISLVTFKSGEDFYGIDIIHVKEIIDVRTIIPIPNSPDFVEGIITLRGNIIPIIDLAKRFRFEHIKTDIDDEHISGIIIMNVYDLTIGILLDKINKIINIPIVMLQHISQINTEIGSEYIKSIVKYDDFFLIILDIKKLFNKNELLQLSGDV